MEALFAGMSLHTMIILTLWMLPWKAWALWLSARRGDIWWFLILLIVSTLGILDMIYIFLIAKQRDDRKPPSTQHDRDQ